MQTYSEIFWSGLWTSGKKKKAKQDRHYGSFCDRVCQHPLTRGIPVNVTRSLRTGTGKAQTQLGSNKTLIRRAPAAHNLPVLLSSFLQQSPDKHRLQLNEKAASPRALSSGTELLMAQPQPGWAGKAKPGVALLAGTVTGAAVSSHPSATILSWCQLLNLLSKKEERITKVCKCFSIYSVTFRNVIASISRTESSHFYQHLKNQFAACNKVHLLNTAAFPPNLYAAFYEKFSSNFSFEPETWK